MSDKTTVRKAVIPAAGFGTRMLPATKGIPKEMLPVAGKPLIQFAVEEAVASGIETVIIITRRDSSILQSHFSCNPQLEAFLEKNQQAEVLDGIRRLARFAEILYVEQEKPLGLAHAIACAQPLVENEPFAVLLPDVIVRGEIPATRQLINAHAQHSGSIIAIREVASHEVERHGIVHPDQDAMQSSNHSVRVAALVEKPSPAQTTSRLGIFGRYILDPAIWKFIHQITHDQSGELHLTNALHLCCRERPVFGHLFEGSCYDAGNQLGYIVANIEIALEDPTLHHPLLQYLSQFQMDAMAVAVGTPSNFLKR
jgi:UTP--glucose-1-phosphate uridylyltransferase